MRGGHADLLRAEVLHAQSEYASELGQVINVAARFHQLQHIAVANRLTLRRAQAESTAVGLLVFQEFLAILSLVEGVAHSVQRIALYCLATVKHGGTGHRLLFSDSHCQLPFPPADGWCFNHVRQAISTFHIDRPCALLRGPMQVSAGQRQLALKCPDGIAGCAPEFLDQLKAITMPMHGGRGRP